MPEPEHSQWTPNLLHQHLTRLMDAQERGIYARITSLEKMIEQSMLAAKEAVSKAEQATERRLEGLNELRAITEDRDKNFYPKAAAEAQFQRLSEQIADLRSRLDESKGTSAGLSTGWQILLASIGAIGVLSMIYNLAK